VTRLCMLADHDAEFQGSQHADVLDVRIGERRLFFVCFDGASSAQLCIQKLPPHMMAFFECCIHNCVSKTQRIPCVPTLCPDAQISHPCFLLILPLLFVISHNRRATPLEEVVILLLHHKFQQFSAKTPWIKFFESRDYTQNLRRQISSRYQLEHQRASEGGEGSCGLLCFINLILGNHCGPGVIPLQGTWGSRILTLHLNYVAGYTGSLLFVFERTHNYSVDNQGLVPWQLRREGRSKVRLASW